MLTLRRAALHDAPFLHALRNDPDVRAASRTTDVITEDEHQRWFAARLVDPATRVYVAEIAGVAIGMGRIDLVREATYELSLAIQAVYRGHGISLTIIDALLHEARMRGGTHAVAVVKVSNAASLRAFLAAGFDGEKTVMLERGL